jgi:hypothetical protein
MWLCKHVLGFVTALFKCLKLSCKYSTVSVSVINCSVPNVGYIHLTSNAQNIRLHINMTAFNDLRFAHVI